MSPRVRFHRTCDAAPKRASLTAIGSVDDHERARRPRHSRGAIARPIVDDDDVLDVLKHTSDDGPDRTLLVEGWNDGNRPDSHLRLHTRRAGSTRTDAAARATTLITDTRPIDRSGG